MPRDLSHALLRNKERTEFFERLECFAVTAHAHTEPPALCYSSVWLSMNCLVLDPKTVIVEASEVYQQEQMDKLGMNVIPCDLRDAYPFGGGLHCSTADVYREGECLDYFPNRVEDPTLVRPEMWK